jgi:tRNA dimethylallyltransferase
MHKNKKLIVIIGPTASGKTALAINYALKYNTEIISCDSRQLYSELNIGVARPSIVELSEAKHHFIASHSIHNPLDAGSYEIEATKVLNDIFMRHDEAILCGGTGLYVDALINGLDSFPDIDPSIINELEDKHRENGLFSLVEELRMLDNLTYNTIDLQNSRRVIRALSVIRQTNQPFSSFKTQNKKEKYFSTEIIYLNPDRNKLYERINSRVELMMKDGLYEEVKNLEEFRHLKPLQTVGYSELFSHFQHELSLDEAIDKIKQYSRNYAKRQITFFSKKLESWKNN